MFALDLFNNDHERRLTEGAVDNLEQRRIDDLAMKMDDLVARAKQATTPEVKQALMKEFQKCKAERDSYYKIKDEGMDYGSLGKAGIGQDIVNKTEKMARATPSTPTSKVASTVKNAAKWLAGKGGPGKEGPTYEQEELDETTYGADGSPAVANAHLKLIIDALGRPGVPNITFEFQSGDAYTVDRNGLETMADYYEGIDNTQKTNFIKALSKPATLVKLAKDIGVNITSPEKAVAPPAEPPKQLDLLEKKKNNSDSDSPKDLEADLAIRKARLKYPGTKSDLDAVVKDKIETDKTTQHELDQLKSDNEEQEQEIAKLQKATDSLSIATAQTPPTISKTTKTPAITPAVSTVSTSPAADTTTTSSAPEPTRYSLPDEPATEPAKEPSKDKTTATSKEPTKIKTKIQTPAQVPSNNKPSALPAPEQPEFDILPSLRSQRVSDPVQSLRTAAQSATDVTPLPSTLNIGPEKYTPEPKMNYRPAKNKVKPNFVTPISKNKKTKSSKQAAAENNLGEHGGGIGPRRHWQDLMQERKLAVGDPIVVTASNEFEGTTGEIYEFSPSGKFVIVDLYNHGKHSMHLSDVEYNQYADDQEEDDWYDDEDIDDGVRHAYDSDERTRSDQFESHMSELDIIAQDLNPHRMSDRQFLKAYGMSKVAFQQKYRTLLKPAQQQAMPVKEANVNPQFINAQVTKLLARATQTGNFASMPQLLAPLMKQYGLTLQQIDGMVLGGLKRAAGEYGVAMKEGWKGGVAGGVAGATGGEVLGSKAGEALGKAIGGHIGAGAVPAPLSSLGSKAGEAIGGVVGSKLGAVVGSVAGGAGGAAIGNKLGDEVDEGFQDFNKVEPYAVCLAGKPVKKFDYYEEARRFHDNWKKKLYREGDKAKADKITLMPLNLDESTGIHPKLVTVLKQRGYKGPYKLSKLPKWLASLGDVANGDDDIMVTGNDPEYDAWVVYNAYGPYAFGQEMGYQLGTAAKVIKDTVPLEEAGSPAQQAAIAIAMKKAGKKPKSLNEYIVRSGDDIMSVMSLNLFADLIGKGNLSDYDEEFANSSKWQAVVAEWAPKAEYLQREIAKYQNTGRKLRDAEADALDATAYDGSDAYENANIAAQYLPKIYNKQASAIVSLLKDGYANPPAGLHEDSAMAQKQWMQSMKQQHPGVTFSQNKTTMKIFALVPGKGKVGEFDPRQQVNEFEVADLVRPGAQTDTPPRRAYSIVLDGRAGKPGGNRYRAVNAWNALAMVFPQDYPGESAQYKVAEVAKKGSAIVKTGIASEDIAETYVSKLSKFVPAEHWRIVGGELEEAKADPTGSWVVYGGNKVMKFKTHTGAKAYAAKNGGKVASSEFYADKIQKQGVAEATPRHFGPKGSGTELARQIRANGDTNWVNDLSKDQLNALAGPRYPKRPKIQVKKNKGVAETVTDVRSEMAKVYNRLAPKIERHRDSFLAGQLYDELENIAELHGAEGEFKRMMAGARNRAHMDYDTNPGGFQNWFWYLPFADEQLSEEQDTSGVERAILHRIMVAHTDLLKQFGPEKVMQAAEEVAYNVGDVDEIGTSDVSAYVAQVKQILGVPEEVNEKWSQKYKSSINCANPKGFSQRAHCAGKKK